METSVHMVNNTPIIKLEGNLTMGAPVNKFRTCVHEVLAGQTKLLAIDLSRLEFLDSSGVGAIAAVTFAVQKAGVTCRFFGAPRRIMDILKLANLHRVIDFFPDESAALSAPSPASPADLAA